MLKRLFDIVASLLAMLVLAPVFALIAIGVSWRDGWPVFYSQIRIGQNGQQFRIYKFRTMKNSGASHLQVTAANDPRITPLGRFLRHSKLDELPQLFNVLKGDMSMVGPRPEVPKYVELWNERQKNLILSVRPGITDQCQLMFLNEEKILAESADPERTYIEIIMPQKLRICEDYTQNSGFVDDLKILLATIGLLAFARNGKIADLLTANGKVNKG